MRLATWTPPWWLNPWRECARLGQRIGDLCETAEMDIATIRTLEDRLAEAERQLRNLQGAQTPEGALPAGGQPDFVLVGIPRPGLGVRVLAARDMAGTRFGMTDAQDPPPRWKIMATLVQPLFVDDQDYGRALARVREIWANWEREAAAHREAIEPGPSGRQHGGSRPAIRPARVMLPPGGDDDGQADSGR